MNGRPGDHPLSDILDYGSSVFSDEADGLVHEIAQPLPRYRLWDLLNWFSPPPIEELTVQLRKIRDELVQQGRDRGWDV